MKIYYYLLAIIFAHSFTHLQAQSPQASLLLKSYQNDTLLNSDKRMQEQAQRRFTAEEVLNKSIKYKNPYRTVVNNQFAGFAANKIGKLAKEGSYPRLFTSTDEFPQIKKRLNDSKIGSELLTLAIKELSNLRNGKDANAKTYQKFLIADTLRLGADFRFADFANLLAVQGLLAQINKDDILLQETGKVAGNFIQAWIRYISTIPTVQGKEMMVKEQVYNGVKMAKLFDFTSNGMTQQQKNTYFNFMLKETTGKYGDGMQLPPHWRRWNHIASALEYPLAILSIENQKGFDKRVYDRGLEVLQDYLTYTFSPEGMSNEGITYTFNPFADDLLLMVAAAKRGKTDFWAHPHLRKLPDWLMHSISPNPDALWSSHGDVGSASTLPWIMMMIMKFYYPQDAKIDYLYANCLPQDISKLPDVSAFVFATDPDKTKAQYNGVPAVEMPLTFFSPQRGTLMSRNKWAKDGILFQFDGRQDMYFQSHDHSDRGNFTLAAHGRWWVVDGWRSTESKYHSVVTIDGRGQGYFATPASWQGFVDHSKATFGAINQKYCYDWFWLKSPVADMLLNKTVEPQWQNGVYAEAAKGLRNYYPDAKPQRDPLRKVAEYFNGNLETNPLIWNEDTWPMRLPNYQVEYAFRTAGLVKGKHDYVLVVDDIKKDNQERLYEWLMPMPLDVEVVSIKQLVDVKQESGALNIGFNTLTNRGLQGDYDILLGDKRMKRNMQEVDKEVSETYKAGRFTPKKGDPQLLVRVLNHRPAPRPNLEPNPRLEVIEKLKTEDMHQFYLRTMDIGKRLVIPSRSHQPDFKVLLFPHLSGDDLPQTQWNSTRTVLTVTFKDQTDIFYFDKTSTGKTKVKLVRDGEVIFDI